MNACFGRTLRVQTPIFYARLSAYSRRFGKRQLLRRMPPRTEKFGLRML